MYCSIFILCEKFFTQSEILTTSSNMSDNMAKVFLFNFQKNYFKDFALINVLWAVEREKYFTFIARYLLHLLLNWKDQRVLTLDLWPILLLQDFCILRILSNCPALWLKAKQNTTQKVTPSPIFSDDPDSFWPWTVNVWMPFICISFY